MAETVPIDPTERADAFEQAFNRIDAHLRKETGLSDRNRGFSDVVAAFERRNPAMRPRLNRLRDYARLRNAMVHERTSSARYVAYPFEGALEDLLRLEQQIVAPLRADQVFMQSVSTLGPKDTVLSLLDLIREHDFTQFPVYQKEWEFAGLVTGNGLSRWLAARPGPDSSLIDLSDHTVEEILRSEEARNNCQFMSRAVPVVSVVQAFRENQFLEAVIFTHSGDSGQAPLGIATQWDITNTDWENA